MSSLRLVFNAGKYTADLVLSCKVKKEDDRNGFLFENKLFWFFADEFPERVIDISQVFETVPIKRTDQYGFTFSIVSITMSPEDPDNISDYVC